MLTTDGGNANNPIFQGKVAEELFEARPDLVGFWSTCHCQTSTPLVILDDGRKSRSPLSSRGAAPRRLSLASKSVASSGSCAWSSSPHRESPLRYPRTSTTSLQLFPSPTCSRPVRPGVNPLGPVKKLMRSIPFETRLFATWYKEARHCTIEMVCSGLQQLILTCNCHLRCRRGVPRPPHTGQIFEMLKVFWAVFSAKRTSVGAALRGL